MDSEIELVRVSSKPTPAIVNTRIPCAVEDTSQTAGSCGVQSGAKAQNLQDRRRNRNDNGFAQSVSGNEQILECPGARGRWRPFLLTPLMPIAFIVGVLVGVFQAVHRILQIILMLVLLVLLLILGPVALLHRLIKGSPSAYRYSSLQNPREIRLVQLQPGRRPDKVRCTLIRGSWDSSSYEALSYAWGRQRSGVEVDRRNIHATRSLSRAIEHLQDARSTRTIWIDALCINQKDNQEKSEQVQQMREIYANARQVVVWLGEDPGFIASAFRQVPVLANATTEELANILNTPGDWKESLKEILRRTWWERIWVIQEVVVAREIILQCGDHTLPWDDLCLLLMRPEVRMNLDIQYGMYKFVERVQYLRDTNTDPKYGLLSLVYDFRHKKATVPHDKIYALNGLIKTPERTSAIQVDYSQTPKDLWRGFAKGYINRYNNLCVLALVDSYGYGQGTTLGCSWCVDWATNTTKMFRRLEESRQPLWNGGLSDPDTLRAKYSAAGGVPALCDTNLVDPDVISVQGFVYDTVVAVGVSVTSKSTNDDVWHIFEQWEVFAGGPWTGDDVDLAATFHLTLTAGNWTKQPNDWRFWSNKEQEGREDAQFVEYNRIRINACAGRCLFITENGSIGLGHSDIKVGDTICILLGADVPFILRKQNHPGPRSPSLHYAFCKRWKHINCCIPTLHKIVGQAYIHSIMQYKGSIKDDSKTKKIVLEKFFLE
jgi:flagellar biosynthesis protein FliQ